MNKLGIWRQEVGGRYPVEWKQDSQAEIARQDSVNIKAGDRIQEIRSRRQGKVDNRKKEA